MSEVIHFRNPPTPVRQAFYAQVSEDSLVSAASDRAFRLYVHLLTFCKKKHGNQCWPSQALLVERTGWSERTVRDHLKELEREGLITILPPRPPQRSHNIYELHMMPGILTDRQHVAARPAACCRSGGKTDRQHVAAETHESRSINHVCESEPILVGSDITQNTRIQGYVVLLQQAGLPSRATELAQLVAPDRDENWLKAWIDHPDRRGPGMLVNAIKQNWDLPPVKVSGVASGAARSGEKVTKGDKHCAKCGKLSKTPGELCFLCASRKELAE